MAEEFRMSEEDWIVVGLATVGGVAIAAIAYVLAQEADRNVLKRRVMAGKGVPWFDKEWFLIEDCQATNRPSYAVKCNDYVAMMFDGTWHIQYYWEAGPWYGTFGAMTFEEIPEALEWHRQPGIEQPMTEAQYRAGMRIYNAMRNNTFRTSAQMYYDRNSPKYSNVHVVTVDGVYQGIRFEFVNQLTGQVEGRESLYQTISEVLVEGINPAFLSGKLTSGMYIEAYEKAATEL